MAAAYLGRCIGHEPVEIQRAAVESQAASFDTPALFVLLSTESVESSLLPRSTAVVYSHGAMKARWSKICALVLILVMMPGAFELMENTAHLMSEGHLAHSTAAGDRHDPAGPEHGCTPIFHSCGCHSSLAFLGPAAPPAAQLGAAGLSSRGAQDPRATGFRPSIDRPPQV